MAKKTKEFSYEEAVKEIQDLLQKMEQGTINLDELIISVERGTSLIKQCQAKLRDVELKIQEIIQNPS